MKSQRESDVMVCRCEGITLSELLAAVRSDGHARAVKMLSRVGMGTCQSRMCRHTIERVLEIHGANDRILSYRPPVRPLMLENVLNVLNEEGVRSSASRECSVQPSSPAASVPLPQGELSLQRHAVLGEAPSRSGVRFTFDGNDFVGAAGEPIAAALLKAGVRTLGHTADGRPRGIFCGVGHCYECRVEVEGLGEVRSCITPLQAGMRIRSLPAGTSSGGATCPNDA